MPLRRSRSLPWCSFLVLVLAMQAAHGQTVPGGSTWGTVPESARQAATSPTNARSRVAAVRYGLIGADPSGARAFEVDSDTEALRGTYRLNVPLFEARGRDEPLRIALQYQARMWLGEQEANLAILDGDPLSAPGWSLNLPKLLGGVLIEADGSRHPARRTQVVARGDEDVEVNYVTTDGSRITYEIRLDQPGSAERTARGVVRYPSGAITLMEGLAGTNENGQTSVLYTSLYPSAIVDRNGNTTTIEYLPPTTNALLAGTHLADLHFRPYSLPLRPSRLFDPMGREVNFHYNVNMQLTAITLSGNNAPARTLARLTYRTIQTYKEIAAISSTSDILIGVGALEAIFLPATRTGYWFGAPDSYNNYGMIVNVREQAEMSHSAASLTEAGTITASGTTVRQRVYDYPMTAPASGDRLDFPRYQTMTETVAGVSTPLVTRYEILEWPGSSQVAITLPDGSIRQLISDSRTGLPAYRENKGRDGEFVSSEKYEWTVGNDGVSRLAQLTQTIRTATSLRSRRTDYTYTPRGFLQDERIRDWVEATQIANAPLLRWVRYTYANDQRFIDRGLAGVISRIEIYDGSSLLPEERTDFDYDTLPVEATPGIERNIFATSGFRPDLRALLPANSANVRGLVTRVNRWVQPGLLNNTATITTLMSYNAAGALTGVNVAGQDRYRVNYNATGKYGLPSTIVAGSSAARFTTSVSWDVNSGLLTALRDQRRTLRFKYDPALRLVSTIDSVRGEVRREFAPNNLSYDETRLDPSRATLLKSTIELNGFGLPRRIVSTPGDGQPKETFFEYDGRGRLARSSKDQDVGATPVWAVYQYDDAGRLSRTTLTDGREYLVDYSRSGAPANAIPTGALRFETDAWGRGRFIVTDALDRIVQVLEPGASGAPWVSTRYTYDARSNLLAIYSDANPMQFPQPSRRFRYDGLSRLTHRRLPERSATLDDTGNLVAAGNWTDRYLYDDQSRLIGHSDPRGVFTSFDYQNDPLDRLFAIRTTAPAGVVPVPDTTFVYKVRESPTLFSNINVRGVYRAAYTYGTDGHVSSITTEFADVRDAIAQRVSRNNAGRVTRSTVLLGSKPAIDLEFRYDGAGRQYRVSSGAWSVTAAYKPNGVTDNLIFASGAWNAREVFTYDPMSDMLTRHQLAINGQPKLDLNYFYTSSTAPPSPLLQRGETRPSGQIRSVLDVLAGQVLGLDYDQLARLTLAISNPNDRLLAVRDAQGFRYAYDAAGNRTQSQAVRVVPQRPTVFEPGLTIAGPSAPELTVLDDAAAEGQPQIAIDAPTNRISSSNYAYDAAGNVTRLPRKDGSVLSLEYDALGRLARVSRGGSPDFETYTYDYRNRLLAIRQSDGSVRYSVWNNSTEQTYFVRPSGSSSLAHAKTTLTLGSRRVAQLSGTNALPMFIHHTFNGTLTTTPNNTLINGTYRPFGTDATTTAPAQNAGYHNYSRNRFGLDYAVNRHYDPETGRFLQPDPLGEAVYRLNDPQTLNLYAFTRNDPVNRRDPVGLDISDECEYVQLDAGWTCVYTVTKTIYQTTVRGQQDPGSIVRSWIPSDSWGWQGLGGPLLDADRSTEGAIDDAAGKLLKKMNEKKEKDQKCAAARNAYIGAANAYARLAAQVAIHNEQIAALEAQGNALGWNITENIFEQFEDPSAGQLISASNARGYEYQSLRHSWKAAKMNKALLEMDQKSVIDAMKSAKLAQEQACRQ